MEVGHGQQLGGTRVEPISACVALALGTVPVAARVIGDSLMTAAQTLIAMASESRSAATNDSIHDLAVLPGKMESMSVPEAATRSANDVGHLEGGPAHRLARLLECLTSLVLATSMASSGLATACRCRRDKCKYTVVSASLACPSNI